MSEELDRSSAQLYFVTGTLTTTPAPLGASTQDLTELVVQASPDNGGVRVLLGDAGSQGWALVAGAEFNAPIRNPALLYGKASAGSAVYALFGRRGG